MPGSAPKEPRIDEGASPKRAGPFPLGVPVAGDVALRISAAAFDFIVLGVVGFALTTVLGVPWLGSSLLVTGLMLVVGAGYFIGSWSRARGATPGMRLFRLTVRDATSGGPITREAAFRRWLVLGAPFALEFFYGWGMGLVISLIVAGYYAYLLSTVVRSPDWRGLHDTFAGTVVTKT
jgi:uncharacterized RDD family membrane protein YckC